MKHPEEDVALADGHAFTVTQAPFKQHLGTGVEFKEVCTIPIYNPPFLPIVSSRTTLARNTALCSIQP